MFDPGSRYASVATITVQDDAGRSVAIVKLRLIPPTSAAITRRVVAEDRPDLLAHHYYKDPTRYWRIADAGFVLDPMESYATAGAVIPIPAGGA
jgi:nucleoid-associated protein YgaU